MTHRGLVTSFTVVAGHSRSVDVPPSEGGTNWEALAATGGTIVVLMGAAHRRADRRTLDGGRPSRGHPGAGGAVGHGALPIGGAGHACRPWAHRASVAGDDRHRRGCRPRPRLVRTTPTVGPGCSSYAGAPPGGRPFQAPARPGSPRHRGAHDLLGSPTRRWRRHGRRGGTRQPRAVRMGPLHLSKRGGAVLRPSPRHTPSRRHPHRRSRPLQPRRSAAAAS